MLECSCTVRNHIKEGFPHVQLEFFFSVHPTIPYCSFFMSPDRLYVVYAPPLLLVHIYPSNIFKSKYIPQNPEVLHSPRALLPSRSELRTSLSCSCSWQSQQQSHKELLLAGLHQRRNPTPCQGRERALAHINAMSPVVPKPGWAQGSPWLFIHSKNQHTDCLGFLHAGSRSKRPSLSHCHLLQLGSHHGFLLLLETSRGVKTPGDCHHAPSHQQGCGRARSFIIAAPDRCFLSNLHDLPNKFLIKAWRPNSLLYLSISFWERECTWTWPGKSNGIHSAIQLHPLYFPFSSSHLGFHILMQFYACSFHYTVFHLLSIITALRPIN